VIPAHKCFHADDSLRCQLYLRLVLKLKLVFVYCTFDLAGEGYPIEYLLVEIVRMKMILIAASIFRAVECKVGLHEHPVRSGITSDMRVICRSTNEG
jgi:hypothetical protein